MFGAVKIFVKLGQKISGIKLATSLAGERGRGWFLSQIVLQLEIHVAHKMVRVQISEQLSNERSLIPRVAELRELRSSSRRGINLC